MRSAQESALFFYREGLLALHRLEEGHQLRASPSMDSGNSEPGPQAEPTPSHLSVLATTLP